MKKLIKILTIIVVVAIVLSLFYISIYTESSNCNCVSKKYGYSEDQETDNPGNEDDNQDNNGDNNGTSDSTHYVFVEDGTATWCPNCPLVGEQLKELYESGNYNFYYVSMVTDKSSKAEKRLKEDYKIVAYPTVFIDGGYKIKIGSSVTNEEFAEAISAAEKRDVPNINIVVNAEFINDTNELKTNVFIENDEITDYNGHLRVYLTEIISRWNEYNTNPYHIGFVDFIIDKDVTIPSKGNSTFSDNRRINEFVETNLVPEDLMIFAVIFSSESVPADSYPDESGGEFNAHYADASDATIVAEGNLPPEIGINLPEVGMVHLFGKPILKTLNHTKTILIFKTTINVTAKDDSGIEKVEFYIDDKLVSTDNEPPYEYNLKKIKLFKRLIRKHTIKAIAYDTQGKTRSTSINVITFFI